MVGSRSCGIHAVIHGAGIQARRLVEGVACRRQNVHFRSRCHGDIWNDQLRALTDVERATSGRGPFLAAVFLKIKAQLLDFSTSYETLGEVLKAKSDGISIDFKLMLTDLEKNTTSKNACSPPTARNAHVGRSSIEVNPSIASDHDGRITTCLPLRTASRSSASQLKRLS